jgi:aspartate-semialdehyde dehydrogenase
LADSVPRIALVGATGTVGSQIAELLGERNFQYSELKLFARDSADRMLDVGDRSLPVARLDDARDLSAFDIAFLAMPLTAAEEIIRAQPGPLLIDLSAAINPPRPAVAMVAPGLIGRERLAPFGRGQVVAVPHPAAQLIATILHGLSSTGFAAALIMLSASAGGRQAISDVFQQSADLLNARLDVAEEPQVAFNIFAPQDGREVCGAIAAQVRLLYGGSNQLLLDIVRVPAFHGSGVALFLRSDDTSKDWPERLRSAPGLILVANQEAAGFVDAVGQEGAIARISVDEAGAAIWCSFDAARLAALTAVWIAETVSQQARY